ncbi:MAG: hypothetical protein F6K17_40175, partial [Okeania sp. SIO3C4]|nr:hypothetical protein [Okeania sp. SIO3C4]
MGQVPYGFCYTQTDPMGNIKFGSIGIKSFDVGVRSQESGVRSQEGKNLSGLTHAKPLKTPYVGANGIRP